jgi:hypothetical protein
VSTSKDGPSANLHLQRERFPAIPLVRCFYYETSVGLNHPFERQLNHRGYKYNWQQSRLSIFSFEFVAAGTQMGLLSRRKSSIQSFGSPPSKENLPYYEKTPPLHRLPGEEGFVFDFPPPTPLKDGTARTNNSMDLKPPPSRQLTKSSRPTTAHSDLSFFPPKLTPKTTKKDERPPSAASRVFFNNGQPISSTGKFVAPRSRLAGGYTVSLRNDTPVTNLRSSASVQSLKVKSLDLLKSNPRLKYIVPDIPPPPPSRSNELQFHHDGRGLFASKTVANIADELDTSGLRKLLDRDTRRYQSSYDLKKQYNRPLNMSEQIPQSRGDTVSRGNTVSTDGYESYGYPSERAYNPFPDFDASMIRPVFQSSRSGSMDSQRFDLTQSYRMSEDSQRREARPQDPIDNSHGNHNLPPTLLFGKDQNGKTSVDLEPPSLAKEESPIVILTPNSAKSTRSQSALLRSPTETSNQRLFEHDLGLADVNTGPSDTESFNAIESDEEDDYHLPILHPYATWGQSPITSISLPSTLGTESPTFSGSRDSPVESEGSWLSRRIDIEKAVLKSFQVTSRRTPPILLESSTLSQSKGHSPLKINTVVGAAVTQDQAWPSANEPVYGRKENGSSGIKIIGIRERIRQGSAARRVKVVDIPHVEGIVGRVSGESIERDFHSDNNGEIVFV